MENNKNNHTCPPAVDEKDGVVVYCASSQRIDPKYVRVANETGRLIARAGLKLVCGGGVMGLMAAAIEGCIAEGGQAIGVLPHFMIEKGWGHPQLTRCIDTPTMHVRKMTMAEMSCAAMPCPAASGPLTSLPKS